MNYRRYNDKNQFKIKICLLMATLILVGLLPCIVRANSNSSSIKRNLFFVKVLNYTMPVVKSVAFNEDDMAENSVTVAQTALGALGLNLKNPLTVISKEAAFISFSNNSNSSNANVSFSQFKLEDKYISKDASAANKPSTDSLNLKDNSVKEYDPNLKKALNTDKPEVLIYHTHTTESYKPGEAISFDNTQNVCAVGDALVNELKSKYGISAINDTTVHDKEAYTQSYARSSVTVNQYINKYKDFKLVIDMHRDSVTDKNATTIKLNGENVSKFMLVMARKNPHFDKNMALANKIIQTSNQLFPGLCKGVMYYNYGTRYFNQDKSNNAILMEIGSDINSTEESKASTKYIARIIAECLNK